MGCDDVAFSKGSSKPNTQGKVKLAETVAELTKEGPNSVTRQAKDAWFVHRITALRDIDLGNYCLVESEFENKSKVSLYSATVSYEEVLTKNAAEAGTKVHGRRKSKY